MRIDALQSLRSLLLAGAGNYDEMQNALRTLHVPFQVSIKDLRSQVREKDNVEQSIIQQSLVFYHFEILRSNAGSFRLVHYISFQYPY